MKRLLQSLTLCLGLLFGAGALSGCTSDSLVGAEITGSGVDHNEYVTGSGADHNERIGGSGVDHNERVTGSGADHNE